MNPRCYFCGGTMIGAQPKGYRCPKCNPKPEMYHPRTDCPDCGVPLGPNRTCPLCDHAYRSIARSGRWILPSKLRDAGTLLGTCTAENGTTWLYAHDGSLFLHHNWNDEALASHRYSAPTDITPARAVKTLRSMLRKPPEDRANIELLAATYDPSTCVVTSDGHAFLASMGVSSRRAPAQRSCACMTVAKSKAGKRR